MILKFVTTSGSIAVLGRYHKLTKADLAYYTRNNPIHWIEAK